MVTSDVQKSSRIWKMADWVKKKIWQNEKRRLSIHCVKGPIRSYFRSVFSCIRTEYRKIRTRNNFVFRHFSRIGNNKKLFLFGEFSFIGRIWWEVREVWEVWGWVFHNFLRLFNGWKNFPFTTSEIKCDYY